MTFRKNRKFTYSFFACKDIKRGDIFTQENIRSVRSRDGCSPKHLPGLLGKPNGRNYKFGEQT